MKDKIDNNTIYDLCHELQEKNGKLLDKIKVLENRVKLLEKENKELKDVLNGIVNTIHKSIEIRIG